MKFCKLYIFNFILFFVNKKIETHNNNNNNNTHKKIKFTFQNFKKEPFSLFFPYYAQQKITKKHVAREQRRVSLRIYAQQSSEKFGDFILKAWTEAALDKGRGF